MGEPPVKKDRGTGLHFLVVDLAHKRDLMVLLRIVILIDTDGIDPDGPLIPSPCLSQKVAQILMNV